MALSINVTTDEAITSIRVAGEITVKTYRQLTEVADALAQQSPAPAKARLDMTDLSYIDSVGLGALIKIFTTLKRAGTELTLTNCQGGIRDSLALTRLDQLLKIE